MDRDITGRAVEGAARTLLNAKKRMRELVPLGPSNVRMTPRELRSAAQRNPEVLQQLVGMVGAEQALQMLLGPAQRRNTDDYLDFARSAPLN